MGYSYEHRTVANHGVVSTVRDFSIPLLSLVGLQRLLWQFKTAQLACNPEERDSANKAKNCGERHRKMIEPVVLAMYREKSIRQRETPETRHMESRICG